MGAVLEVRVGASVQQQTEQLVASLVLVDVQRRRQHAVAVVVAAVHRDPAVQEQSGPSDSTLHAYRSGRYCHRGREGVGGRGGVGVGGREVNYS